MAEQVQKRAADEVVISEEALEKAEHYIEAEEGVQNRLTGWLDVFVRTVAVVMSLFHLYSAYAIVPTQELRMIHVGFVLFLTFLLFPIARRLRNRVCWWDWICAILGLVAIGYGLAGGDDFIDRNTIPTQWDMVFGVILVVLVLEAARRSTGWIMPAVCLGFIAYAMAGPYLPAPWTHRGNVSRDPIVPHVYDVARYFRVAVDVSSSLIILFTIYGAFLQHSGAGKFFIDFSFAAMGGKPTGAGRDDRACLVPAWWTLGQRGSDDGNARHRGLSHARQGGLRQGRGRGAARRGWAGRDHLAAVLGAAAFLIAEFLKISYLDVILMATIPTCLFYFALFLMVELDARKFGMRDIPFARGADLVADHPAVLVPFLVAGGDHRLHADGLLSGAVGVLGDGHRVRSKLPASRQRAPVPTTCFAGNGVIWRHLLQSKFCQGARSRLDRRPQRRRYLRCGGHHRGRGFAHRAGIAVQRDRPPVR